MVTNNAINVATGATGTILRGAGVGTAPVFSTATYPATTGANTMLISTSANVVTTAPFIAATAFTPVLAFGGASVGITYITQVGMYTRIGNLVSFFINIILSSNGTSTGTATITGLPVTSANDGNNYDYFMLKIGTGVVGSTGFYADIAANSTILTLAFFSSTVGSGAVLTEVNIGDNEIIRIVGSYLA